MSKANQVRARILEAKEAGEDQAVVVAWAIENLGMSKGLANTYVKENWDKKVKTEKKVSSEKIKTEKPPKEKKPRTKTPVNLTEAMEMMKSVGFEIISFDGGKIETPEGNYSMFGKDIYFRHFDEAAKETVVEVFKTAEFVEKVINQKVLRANTTLHIKD